MGLALHYAAFLTEVRLLSTEAAALLHEVGLGLNGGRLACPARGGIHIPSVVARECGAGEVLVLSWGLAGPSMSEVMPSSEHRVLLGSFGQPTLR